MPNSGKKEVTMNKVLFPKKDYVKELGRIFKSSKNSQKLVKTIICSSRTLYICCLSAGVRRVIASAISFS